MSDTENATPPENPKSGSAPVKRKTVKRKVADSFALWLRRVVDSGGVPYWWSL